ncbi:hypothetical protein ACFQ3Z_07520 [Streptomyces nogalater]
MRLMQASHTATLEQLPAMIAEHAAAAGMYDVAIFVVDVRDTVLRRLTGKGPTAGRAERSSPFRGACPARHTSVWNCSRNPKGTRRADGGGGWPSPTVSSGWVSCEPTLEQMTNPSGRHCATWRP